MMKKCTIAIMAAAFAGCSNHGLIDGEAGANEAVKTEVHDAMEADRQETDALIDKARWGDGQAYLQLANRYRQGIGVNKDYLGMMYMSLLAVEHGSIKDEKEYIASVADGECKTFLELMNSSRSERKEKRDSMLAVLNAMESADAMVLAGTITVACGDTIGGLGLIEKGAERGSSMAKIVKIFKFTDKNETPDAGSLLLMAKETPLLYPALIEKYRYENDEESKHFAAYCCKEAERHALLRVNDARWLLEYYKEGGNVQLTDEDVKRLEAFVQSDIKNKDAVAVDSVCECDVVEETRDDLRQQKK